jgi:3-deoxy-7-phosphoheptulonate synthase
MLARAREEVGIAVVTEAMEPAAVEMVGEIADIIQIGSRNMHNYPLLRAAGRQSKPVLLKRGMSATLEEWLGAAEYILNEGNPNVVLCERGIRTFSRHSRHTLDIGVIPVLRERTTLPVIIDPSHATGAAGRVPSMAMAALAAGADGLLIEVHPEPDRALSDGFQALSFEIFDALMSDLGRIAAAVGREI